MINEAMLRLKTREGGELLGKLQSGRKTKNWKKLYRPEDQLPISGSNKDESESTNFQGKCAKSCTTCSVKNGRQFKTFYIL